MTTVVILEAEGLEGRMVVKTKPDPIKENCGNITPQDIALLVDYHAEHPGAGGGVPVGLSITHGPVIRRAIDHVAACDPCRTVYIEMRSEVYQAEIEDGLVKS